MLFEGDTVLNAMNAAYIYCNNFPRPSFVLEEMTIR
jgi:hypothetical protein